MENYGPNMETLAEAFLSRVHNGVASIEDETKKKDIGAILGVIVGSMVEAIHENNQIISANVNKELEALRTAKK